MRNNAFFKQLKYVCKNILFHIAYASWIWLGFLFYQYKELIFLLEHL